MSVATDKNGNLYTEGDLLLKTGKTVKVNGEDALNPYQVWVGVASQSDTDATFIEKRNTLGGTGIVTMTRQVSGLYLLHKTGAFSTTPGRVIVLCGGSPGSTYNVTGNGNTVNDVVISTSELQLLGNVDDGFVLESVGADNILHLTPIEVRVYAS